MEQNNPIRENKNSGIYFILLNPAKSLQESTRQHTENMREFYSNMEALIGFVRKSYGNPKGGIIV